MNNRGIHKWPFSKYDTYVPTYVPLAAESDSVPPR